MIVEGNLFKSVTYFKYLGHILLQKNGLKMEISTRLQISNRYFLNIGKILSSRVISTNLKIQMYMPLIRFVALYTFETWPLRYAEERKLRV